MIKKLKYIFAEERKILFFYIFIIIFLISLFEALSIGSVFPLLNLLISKEKTNIDFIDRVLFSNNSENYEPLVFFCVGVTLIFIVKNLLLGFFSWYKIKITQNISKNLQIRMLRSYLSIPIDKFLETNSSIMMRNINGEPKMLLKQMISPFFVLLQDVMVSIGLIILLISSFSTISAYSILFSILFLLPIYFYSKIKLKIYSKKRLILHGATLKFLRESIELIREIKIYNKATFFLKRYLRSLEKLNFVNLNISFIGLLPKLVLEIILVAAGLSLLFFLVFVSNIKMIEIIPSLALIGAVFLKLVPSFIRILAQYQKIEYAKPSLNLIENILLETNKNKQKIYYENNFEEFKTLELKNISHNFGDKKILNEINLKISKGDTILIHGESGNGKTTLLNILSGLLEPKLGKVKVNDKDHDYSKPVVTNLSFVRGENYFIDSNIIENIALKAMDDLNNDEIKSIEKLITLVNMDEFLNQLDLEIGEKGNKLSDGQKQRLAIARALYNKPDLLILDEATNSIDLNNEKIIFENILKTFSYLTIIFVNHRETNFLNDSKIFLIENGKINEK